MVPEAGLEPARTKARGILSPLCLPIPPLRHAINMEATPGFEPGIRILQTPALPLGYVAGKNGAGNGIRTRDVYLGKVELYH